MNRPNLQPSELPLIAKYIEASRNEIQSHDLSRCAIGYILHGEKSIYYGDMCYKFSSGDVFFLNMGCHYIRNSAEGGCPFEQILFYFSTSDLQQMLLNLSMTYKLNATNEHSSCEQCQRLNHAAMPAWNLLRHFFENVNSYLSDESFYNDSSFERLKMTELLYLIVSHEDCCLKNKLLCNINSSRDTFQQIIHANIFSNASINELAEQCHRSMTSFKKEFNDIYGISPHQWFIRQRLIHARLLLISTDKPISEIGAMCAFSNTSHFIKLFRKQYNMTPANYRLRHQTTESDHSSKKGSRTEPVPH